MVMKPDFMKSLVFCNDNIFLSFSLLDENKNDFPFVSVSLDGQSVH